MERQQDYVLRTVEERGVRLIRLWFTDVLGQLKSFAISPAELENAFDEGMHFDGSAIDGFSRVQESDVLARPDPNSFELLPWADSDGTSARMFCDIRNLDGSPFEGDPRQVLRRNLDRARERGFSFYAAPEMEFFYFADADTSQQPEPLDQASYFDLTTADVASDLRQRTIHTLEAMGIPVEYSHHEDGPSQHEIDLRYTDALTMADNVMTFRLVVREVALEAGVHATFMPKPLAGVQGSGMHTHFSLFEGDTNAFYDAGDPRNLSKVARGFIAGLLHHAREITAVTNQWVNSYKRLVIGYEAPIYISWARNNRSVVVNVPPIKAGKASLVAARVPGARSRLQPLPRLLGRARRRTQGDRGGLRPARRGAHQPLLADRRGAAGRGHLDAARLAVGGPRRDGALRAGGRGARRARVRVVHPQQAGRVEGLQDPGHPVRARPLPATPVRSAEVLMEPLLLFPDPAPPELVQALDLGRLPVEGGARRGHCGERTSLPDGWAGAIVVAADEPERAYGLCRGLRKRDVPLEPLLLLVTGGQISDLELREDLFDDFCLWPFQPREMEARLKHLLWRTGRGTGPELVEYADLALNLETYQAAVAGKPLDLTYMEYELLKFLVSHPGKVFTRETLLSRVWGYEYYGGARTVDVHIRRLRAKLGEEHANLIQTVRSVGYRFGQSRWGV